MKSQFGTIIKSNQKALKWLSVLFFVIANTGCSEFLKGKPKDQGYIEIKNQNMNCLDNLSTDFSKFLDARGTEQDVDNTVSCISKILTEFQLKVEGRTDKNSFTDTEVYDIFRTFAPEASLSQNGAKNIIVLKSALLGGATDKITKSEITDLINYLEVVKVEAKSLLPYLKVYFLDETQREFSQIFIREAFSKLNGSIKRLLQASKIANSNYSFNQFKNLIIDVLNLADEDANLVEIMARVNFVLNGSQSELSESERLKYIDNITEFLRLASLYRNNYIRLDLKNIDDVDDTINFVNEIFVLLENSLQYKKTGQISSNSIDRLLVEIAAADFFENPVKASSLIGFYKAVMVRMFESSLAGKPLSFSGIKQINLINIKRELAAFQIYARIIKKSISQDFIAAGITSYNLVELQRVVGGLSPNSEQDVLTRFDSNNQFQVISIVNQMKSQFTQSKPLVYHRKKMGIANNQDSWNMTREDLLAGLFYQTVARLLMLGYSPSYNVMGVPTGSLNDIALYTWYSEFKALMIDLKSWDPRAFNSGTTLVKTGNLFTRSGNGDSVLSFNELHESLAIQLSGGPLLEEIEADLDTARCNLPELDVFNKNWKIESCFDQVVQANYRKYFSSLPHLIFYLESLSSTQFTQYFRDLLNVARRDIGLAGQRIETSDLTLMGSMAFFIEQVYDSHDMNRNNQLSESEIRQAYPKFKLIATEFAETTAKADMDKFTSWIGTVGGYGCYSREDLIKESFIFLVYNGRTPGQSDLNSFPCFTGKSLINFNGEVNRSRLTQTFMSLKSVISP